MRVSSGLAAARGVAVRPPLHTVMPDLPFDDVPAAVRHYRDVLGFSVNHEQADLGVMDRARGHPRRGGGMTRRAIALAAAALGIAAAAAPPAALAQQPAKATEGPVANTLTAEEKAAGWRLLFDGKTTAGWRGYRQESMPAGWQAVGGALTRVGQAGDIVTVDEFEDFELTLEWLVGPGGNSGIFFRASETTDFVYMNAPEMQVLDDAAHADGLQRLTAAGSNYALHPAPEGVLRPAGEWNSVRILVRGDHVEQWMNGVKVVEYELGSADWKARVAKSKFAAWPQYGKNARGHIGLQDHGDRVAFRNIKVRVLR